MTPESPYSKLGIATILHWDRFNHSHIAFYTWATLYFTTPFLVFAVWLRNRTTDPDTAEPNEVIIPQMLRLFIGVVGVITLAVSLRKFVIRQSPPRPSALSSETFGMEEIPP